MDSFISTVFIEKTLGERNWVGTVSSQEKKLAGWPKWAVEKKLTRILTKATDGKVGWKKNWVGCRKKLEHLECWIRPRIPVFIPAYFAAWLGWSGNF